MAKLIQQQETRSETVSSSGQLKSSNDGTNFEFKSGIRYQNEEDVAYVLPNDYNGKNNQHTQISSVSHHSFLFFFLQSSTDFINNTGCSNTFYNGNVS